MRKIYLSLLIVINLTHVGWAQSDILSISQSDTTVMNDKYERIYKLFLEERETRINHLWKVDLLKFSLIEPNIKFEQRLGKHFTMESQLRFKYPVKNHYYFLYGVEDEVNLRSTFYQDLKFYYNIKSRLSKGKNVNGFSANYIALSFIRSYVKYKELYQDNNNPESLLGLGFTYGLQRRIGNIGYRCSC